MLIECPACRTRAKLSADAAGTKARRVRCVECGGVFVAAPSVLGGSAASSTGKVLAVSIGVVGFISLCFIHPEDPGPRRANADLQDGLMEPPMDGETRACERGLRPELK